VGIVDPEDHQMGAGPSNPHGSIPSTNPRRVVVVDDHELLRTGTRRILDDAIDFTVVGEAADGDVALRIVAELQPNVVLIDIRLPTVNGIDVARQIAADYPAITVLILTAYDDEHYVRAALAAGVSGYLLKTTPGGELIQSIRAACDGSKSLASSLTGRGEKEAAKDSQDGSPRLTTREQEVVRLVARGMSNKSIARDLGISPRTVEGHLNHVFEKVGTASRTELVHYALAIGLFVRDPGKGMGTPQ
jgi:DNA-binding NarL/FixJ family response regulator